MHHVIRTAFYLPGDWKEPLLSKKNAFRIGNRKSGNDDLLLLLSRDYFILRSIDRERTEARIHQPAAVCTSVSIFVEIFSIGEF
jgi:hypothetical protein